MTIAPPFKSVYDVIDIIFCLLQPDFRWICENKALQPNPDKPENA
jgi:hypothetical protein